MMVRLIELRRNKLPTLITRVSDEDYDYLSQSRWHAEWSEHSKTYYVRRNFDDEGNRRSERMHRIIMGVGLGNRLDQGPIKQKMVLIDHIDFDGLNNERSNLRISDWFQSGHNVRKRQLIAGCPPSSRFKGVSKSHGKWQVWIRAYNVCHYLGIYEDEVEAALVWNEAAKIYHKEFAVLNEIP
jgi:hypothetical protein